MAHLDHSIFTVSRWLTQKRTCIAPNLNYKSFVNKTYCKHTPSRVNSCVLFHHCSMSRFWQLFRPALARKAGQLDPQTLAGSLVELSWHFPKLLHREALRREAFTQRSFLAHNDNRNCSSKTESRRHSKKRCFWSILSRNYRSLDAPTRIRFTTRSCKRQ